MDPGDVKKYLAELKTGWIALSDIAETEPSSRPPKKIKKEYHFKDFKESIAFVNQVAGVAESENHHPDILIVYDRVQIELWTHAIMGLSENDFIMAAKIDQLI